MVAGDRDRLKQVLVNLIDNAIKYTPQGGEVRVSVTASGGKAQLKVQDNGIGVDPAHHVRIWIDSIASRPIAAKRVRGLGSPLSARSVTPMAAP